MDAKQSTEFNRRLVALAEVFDVKLSPQRQALYFEALRDLELGLVVQALNQAVRACKFFPRPVELRSFVLGDSEDRTERAWMAFQRAMHYVGAYASVIVQDAALGEAITSMFGSWAGACVQEYSPEMWAAKRKEFGRVYRVLVDRNLEGGRYLPGRCEQVNAANDRSMAYVPVHEISASGIVSQQLLGAAAEQARQTLSTRSQDFSRLCDRAIERLRLIPKSMEEPA